MKTIIKCTDGSVAVMTFPERQVAMFLIEKAVAYDKATDGGYDENDMVLVQQLSAQWTDEYKAEALRKWGDVNPGKYLSHRDMPDEAVPTDRRFRDAWRDTTPELVIDIDADKAKTLLSGEADKLAAQKRGIVVAGISPAEMASWPIKLAEATKYTATGLDADAPNLAREATARRVTPAALVAKVITKANALANLEALIAGTNGMHGDAIAQLTTVAELQAYDVEAGWPV